LPSFPRPPIHGIKVEAGFACGVAGCEEVYLEYASIKKHCSQVHPGLGAKNTHQKAFLQQVYRGHSAKAYIRVTEKQQSPETQGEYLEAYLAHRPESPPPAGVGEAPKPPWVERIGWAGRLDTLQPELLGLLLSAAQKPTNDSPLACLGQVIYMYFCLAGAATKELPVYVRLKLNSKNRWANAFMDQSTILIGITLLSESVRAMFHAPQQDETIRRYARWNYRLLVWTIKVCALYREGRMIGFLHLPPNLLEATNNLEQLLEANPLVDPVSVLVPLHHVYRGLLVYFYTEPHTTQLDPFNAFLMVAHWHQDGHFSSPHHITPNIAAQQWGGRAFFLMEMLRVSQQGMAEHKGYFGLVILSHSLHMWPYADDDMVSMATPPELLSVGPGYLPDVSSHGGDEASPGGIFK